MIRMLIVLALVLHLSVAASASTPERQPFIFTYQDLVYSGEVMLPGKHARGTIVIIPGHGSTELVGGNQFLSVRQFLVDEGFSVAYWDKAGCGASEGQYDHNQSIDSSADEAVAALAALEQLDPPGFSHLGMWSISRGGWIVPAITERYQGLDFWVSVSGTSVLADSRYTLEANLHAQGRDDADISALMAEWDDYQRILVRGGSLNEFLEATPNLMADPYFNSNEFTMTEEQLTNIQGYFQSGDLQFDQATNLAIMYPSLETALERLSIPVLAILGKLDTQVDWQATSRLYAKAANAGNMMLTTVLLEQCNHVMQKSVTGGVNEDLPPSTPACDGYYAAMQAWLQGIGDPS
ncbi:MAG: alpha/beta hydrolase [Pseudomonadota bacterium]